MFRSPAILAALCCASIAGLPGQQQEVETSPSDTIQVEVNVVNIPVTVTDSEGRFIIDLEKSDFEVYEDGQRVEIRYFTKSTDTENLPPLEVGFLVDLSNSARLYYKTYRDSIGDLAYVLVPEQGRNHGFLIGYHTEVDLLVDRTNDPVLIAEKMENLKHGGGSAFIDAVYKACAEKLVSTPYQGPGEPRKAIVIVGDGHDNASKRTLDEVIAAAQQNQVTIYAVSTVAWGRHEKEEENLYRLARATGGRVVQPLQGVHKDVPGYLSKPQDAGNFVYTVGTGEYAQAQLQALYSAILAVAGEVRSQYILGYAPPTPLSERKFRRLEVKVNLGAEVEVRHRTGYYPPSR